MKQILLFLTITVIMSNPAFGFVSSTFDSDSDGWIIADLRDSGGPYNPPLGYYTISYSTSGGYSGGFIWRHDPSNYSFSFEAPSKYLGDKSSHYGGVLRFALKTTTSNWSLDNVVILVGNNGKVITSQILPLPTTSWQTYTILLKETNFRYNNKNGAAVTQADFESVLGNLKALRINGEYGAQVEETTSLDTVELSNPTTVGISNQALTHPAAVLAGSRYRFTTWGIVTTIDANYFKLDDGSRAPIKVYAPGYTSIATGSFAKATGFLDTAGTEPIMRCVAGDVVKLK